MTVLREDFEVRNAIGTVLYTSSEKRLAQRWAKLNCERFPGLVVEWVIVTEARRKVYRPTPQAAEKAA